MTAICSKMDLIILYLEYTRLKSMEVNARMKKSLEMGV